MIARYLLFLHLFICLGYATEVRVTDQVVGKTPAIIGINTGDMPQGSAFPEWIRALGVDGARLRLNIAPESAKNPKITSAADLARKAKELRAQAEKKTPLLWQYPSKMSTESLHALREAKIELVQPDQPKRNQTLGDRLNSHKVN